MKTFKNIGLIVCGDSSTKTFNLSSVSRSEGYTLKKVYTKESISEDLAQLIYPQAEIVTDKHALLQDASLDLIVVSAPVNSSADLVSEVLRSGKPVRVVSQV